jgi:alpha-beta hydrolase superfamily lysophospholipase
MVRYLHGEHLDIADSIHEVGTVQCDSLRLVVHAWIPPHAAGTVFLVHGYYSQSGIWSEHIQRLVAKNMAVVAFDLPGHGLSDGARMDADSFPQYANALRVIEDSMARRAPKPWSLVGHSLGGGIVLDRALRGSFPYSRVLLIAPMLRYQGWTWIGTILPAVSAMKPYMERKHVSLSSADTVFQNRILTDSLEGWQTSTHWLKSVRTWNATLHPIDRPGVEWMLLQGGLDQTIDWNWGDAWLKANIPGLQIRFLPLARHHVLNEAGATGVKSREIFDAFLTHPLPIPSK